MVRTEKHRSRSPMSRDRKKKEHGDSPPDHVRRHKRHNSRSRSPRNRSSSPSSDLHRRRQRDNGDDHHNRRKQRSQPGQEGRQRHSESEVAGFELRHPIKQEAADVPREQRRSIKQEAADVPHEQRRSIKQEAADVPREQHRHRQQNNDRRREARRQRERQGEDGNFGQPSQEEASSAAEQEKEKPNFELSGKLTEDTNTYRGVVIKYNEPAEARKPKRRWRLYGFKGDESLPMLPIHRQSAYLLGRDRRVADIPVDHPSCSKQHAVLQYRLIDYNRPDGTLGRKVRPYIIDLGSANGTYVNNQRIDAQRYVELMERDLIKFGFSSREYVLLHENVDTSEVAQDSDTD